MRIIRNFMAVLLLVLCGALWGNVRTNASQTAAEPDLRTQKGSITVTVRSDGTGVSGGSFLVYQAAVLSESGNEFAFTEAFRDFAVSELTSGYSSEDGSYVAEDVFGADTEENEEANTAANRKMAADLAAYIRSAGSAVPVYGTLTLGDGTGNSQAGTGTFRGPSGEGLPAGMYLFLQDQPGAGMQPVSPFLVSLPRMVNGAYVFDVDAYPKPGTAQEIGPAVQVCPSVLKQVVGSGADPTMVTEVEEGTYFQFDFTALGTDDASSPDCPMPVNESGSAAEGGPVVSASASTLRVQIGGAGTIPVGTITFTREGNYYYQVTERTGSDPNYDYDPRVYWLKYSVTPNADHTALEVSEYLVRDGNAEGEQLFPAENGDEPVFTFTNVQYQEDPEGTGENEDPTEPALDGNKGGDEGTPGGGNAGGGTPGGGTSGGSGVSGSSVSGGSSRALPQTGQLWWPVWVLSAAGVILVLIEILMRHRRIFLGLLCFAGAVLLTGYNYWDAARAEKASSSIMRQMEKLVGETEDLSDPEQGEVPAGLADSSSAQVSYREMPAVEIDGDMYIGFLEIPSLNLTLPVMQKWDYDRLKISPCRYSGSYFTDDLVICAHNYARHFSPVKGISMGADVWFITAAGKKLHYTATNIQTIAPADIDEMIQNNKNSLNGSDWDLTLFTCNTGGTTRCAVRCERTADSSAL